MSDPPALSAAELAAIQARTAAATPGPWSVEDEDELRDANGSHLVYVYGDYEHSGAAFEKPADAAFCAAAREDIPRLLAEVQRLRQQVAALGGDPDVVS
jgi:hypothetical protein